MKIPICARAKGHLEPSLHVTGSIQTPWRKIRYQNSSGGLRDPPVPPHPSSSTLTRFGAGFPPGTLGADPGAVLTPLPVSRGIPGRVRGCGEAAGPEGQIHSLGSCGGALIPSPEVSLELSCH